MTRKNGIVFITVEPTKQWGLCVSRHGIQMSMDEFRILWLPGLSDHDVHIIGPVRIRHTHSSHDFGWQFSHSVDISMHMWQANMASMGEFRMLLLPWATH